MYTQFYGLREKPFSLSPDPRYLFLSDPHREALAHLLYGIEQGEGFIAITGEVGTGKTTLCRTLLQRLEAGTEVAFIFNPQLTGLELLQAINAELGLSVEDLDRRELVEQLNRFLLARKREGRRVLLIVDEAQVMERDALEQVRLLSNLETNTAKLIQIVLIGQPELDTVLESPDLRQLRQRISVRWRLDPLSASDTREYVRHRLRIAAGAPRELFTDLALREIHRRSKGVPRVINLLCDRALLAGYAAGAKAIGLGLVTQTDREVRVSGKTKPRSTAAFRLPWPKRKTEGTSPTVPGEGRLQALMSRDLSLPPWLTDGAMPVLLGVLLLSAVVFGWLLLDPLSGFRDDETLPPVASAPPSADPEVAAANEVRAPQGSLDDAIRERVALDPWGGLGVVERKAALLDAREQEAEAQEEETLAGPIGPEVELNEPLRTASAEIGDERLWSDLPSPEELVAAPLDLGVALGKSSPAVTIASSLDVLLLEWSEEKSNHELLALPKMVSTLRDQGFSLLNLRDARMETLAALDLPALLVLRPVDGAPRYVALTSIRGDKVRLEGVGPAPLEVSSDSITEFWDGEAFVPWRDFEGLPSVLRPGSTGDHVRWLQESLLQLGLYGGEKGGTYDAETVAGVRALQQRSELGIDGTVGPVTKIHLYRSLSNYVVPQLSGLEEQLQSAEPPSDLPAGAEPLGLDAEPEAS